MGRPGPHVQRPGPAPASRSSARSPPPRRRGNGSTAIRRRSAMCGRSPRAPRSARAELRSSSNLPSQYSSGAAAGCGRCRRDRPGPARRPGSQGCARAAPKTPLDQIVDPGRHLEEEAAHAVDVAVNKLRPARPSPPRQAASSASSGPRAPPRAGTRASRHRAWAVRGLVRNRWTTVNTPGVQRLRPSRRQRSLSFSMSRMNIIRKAFASRRARHVSHAVCIASHFASSDRTSCRVVRCGCA